MLNKKLELKRLVIFVVLAYAISWIPAIILNKTIGYHDWFETNKVPLFTLPVIYGPALANILTRLITKEDWSDSMLHLRLKGNLKFYVIAVFLPVITRISSVLLTDIIYGNGDFSGLGAGLNGLQIASVVINAISLTPLMAFNTFGEEFGWRGYMNRKLEPLFGTTGTVVIGGIIWGLWHAELTVEGHNFGVDYPGYPYMGFLSMCIFCSFMGMCLMWLTKKTGSVYPAAICHAANNFGSVSIAQLFVSGVPEDTKLPIGESLLLQIPMFAVYSIFFVLMLLDVKKKKA